MAQLDNQWFRESAESPEPCCSLGSEMAGHLKRITKAAGVTWLLCILICLFGMSSWVAVNGLWAEMPALVPVLPEGYLLPSMVVIITQISNIGPLIYLTTNGLLNFLNKKRVDLEVPGVFVLVLLGVVTCVLLAIFWDRTSFIFNNQHSTPLLVLAFFLALVDCTSSVVYIPYMERFPEKYISVLFVGEGFGALCSSLTALIQGAYKQSSTNSSNVNESFSSDNNTSSNVNGLLFGVDTYFVFLAILTAVSGGAFVLLNWLPCTRRLMVRRVSLLQREKFYPVMTPQSSSPLNGVSVEPSSNENSNIFGDIEHSPLILTPQKRKHFSFKEVIEHIKISPRTKEILSLTDLFIQIGWLNLLSNGAIAAVSVFVFGEYGNSTYHLAVNLGIAANPFAALVAMFLPCVSRYFTVMWTFISSAFGVAIIVLAAMAPLHRLPLVHSNWGSFIVILLSVLSTATLTYTKVSIARTLKDYGKASLVLCGVCIQIGSLIGAVVFYFLVNNTAMFTG